MGGNHQLEIYWLDLYWMNKLPGWMILVESLQPCGGVIRWGWTIWQTSCWVLSGCNKFNIAWKSHVCRFFHQILVSRGLFFVSFARRLVAGNSWNYTFPRRGSTSGPWSLWTRGHLPIRLDIDDDVNVRWRWRSTGLLRRFQLFIDFQQKEVHCLLP